ncbi:hypothetical protein Cylst_4108 [Cylindrospermum stagnale PCC 7417]|uniref:Uncharacterized protein n=1 Tax=Cylindrospermum stagnale PCC 7417 TaxID=56107 RepID=K9X2B2_9NOST|nr:hypothetical protein [Cylindrospermum stagnale]AFZ26214.1 hypothetical protein Cylst_4108 [Cylindrospermum stagnale PCC 7417]
MNKFWQFFVAPGDEDTSLPIASSPWHNGRCVTLPRGHWELIIDYAKSINSEYSDKLNFYSFATNNDDENNFVYYEQSELDELIKFIFDLQQSINASEPIHPEATEELPDLYENSEYVRMLEAVSAVFQEALNLREPFHAWIE